MKKILSLFLFAVMAQAAMAVDVVVDEPITSPSGTKVSGLIRSASSFFFSEYGFDYDANKTGGAGEYIIGDDGCIYLKEAVSTYDFGTYLKLDKVDDETYVCHTLQVAAVSSALEPVFVVRLVFNQISETSFTYQVEVDENGVENTDIYFTLKDGNLMQRDRETINMNGVIYPHEIIGLANDASGSWNGYGDGLLTLRKASADIPTPPAGAEAKPASLLFNSLYDTKGLAYQDACVTSIVEDGNNIYVKNPVGDTDTWFMGTLDREAGTVTFLPQYIGQGTENHMWMLPATYNDNFEMIDEEENYGLWSREKTAAEQCILKYKDGEISCEGNQALLICWAESDITKELKAFAGFNLKPYIAADNAKPANPVIGKFSPYDDFWWEGSITYFAAPVDTWGYALDTKDLYINVYHDDVAEPYAFTSSDSYDLQGKTVDLPYSYAGEGFTFHGARHRFYFYKNWQEVGIQLVYKHNGNETRSDIVYATKGVVKSGDADGDNPSAIRQVNADKAAVSKHFENGKLVIMKNGVKYNVSGVMVK